MPVQYGAALPVYGGTRYQRGGGFLSSIANFILPTAKKMLTETAKVAPGVIDSIINKKQSVGSALLGGLKTAGSNTAKDTFRRVTGKKNSGNGGIRKRPAQRSVVKTKQRRKAGPKDIFT